MLYISHSQGKAEMKRKFSIDKKFYPAISRIFSPVVLDSIAVDGRSGYMNEVIKLSNFSASFDLDMSLSDFFDFTYDFCVKNYRNEYVYKNAIANKILLGRHSLNTSTMLTEFRAGSCKADVVILNGSSAVYEIKSEYDTFERLENQIAAYLDIFDNIYVVTDESQVGKLKELLPEIAGIIVLTKKNTLKTVREAGSNKKNVKPDMIFDSLRQSEYTRIIKSCFGKVPDVPNTKIFRECKELFCTLKPETAHDAMVKELKKRSGKCDLGYLISSLPSSLSSYAVSTSVKKGKNTGITNLIPKLNKKISEFIEI